MALAGAGGAHAAVAWTLVGSPLTATTGTLTRFELTATNEQVLSPIGCIEIDVTAAFGIDRTQANNGWSTTVTGSIVRAKSPSMGSRLEFLESVDIRVEAVPLAPGTWTWSARAYPDLACGGTPLAGLPVVAIVVTGAAATPTPVAPTLSPTPVAPSASPSLVVPTPPVPTLPVPTLPLPTLPIPTLPVPTATARLAASPTPGPGGPDPTGSPSATSKPGAGSSSGTGGGAATTDGGSSAASDDIALRSRELDVDIGLERVDRPLGALLVVSVPAVVVGLPGLLILLAIAAQSTGGAAWVAVVRRQLGDRRQRRRVRFVRRST